MGKHKHSIDNKIVSRIYGKKRGWVFTPNHFDDLGSRDAVASSLKRYKRSGLIRQLARGLYDYPLIHDELGILFPSTEAIAEALKGRDATRIQPSGAYAANLLGLSLQVPMKVVFLTDGRSCKVQVDNLQIILKQTTPRNMATAGKVSGLVIQALKYLGKENVGNKEISILADRLSDEDKKLVMKDIRYAPGWIAAVFRELNKREANDG